MKTYKPQNYNSLSSYLIVDDAQKLIELLGKIFDAKVLRKFDREDGKIAHVELKLDYSELMISDSTKNYPDQKTILHFYGPDVFKTFEKAIANGCEVIEEPVNKEGDADTRGSFYDCAGNYWAISSQMSSH